MRRNIIGVLFTVLGLVNNIKDVQNVLSLDKKSRVCKTTVSKEH